MAKNSCFRAGQLDFLCGLREQQQDTHAARMALVTSVLLGGFYALARIPLAELFTNDRSVIEAMEPFMLLLALAQPFMGLHFTLGGALRGARVRSPDLSAMRLAGG